MKNKKALSVILSLSILFGMFSVSAYALEENSSDKKVSVEVYMLENYISDGNLLYKGLFTIIGRYFDVAVRVNGLETLSDFVFEIDYNKDTVSLAEFNLSYGSSDINYMPLFEQLSDYNEPLKLRLYDERGIAAPKLFTNVFRFKAEEKGNFDFSIRVLRLVDGDGNEYEPEININLPRETYLYSEIPQTLPDFETSLSYGFSRYIKTELAYPMTVGEFVSKLKNNENCEAVVTSYDGKTLTDDDYIPTGAKLLVLFDNMIVFESTLMLIGDVNRDARINAADARLVLRFSAKLEKYRSDTVITKAANVASDTNEITAADARELLRHSASVGSTYADWYKYHCVLEKYNNNLINDNL